MKSRPSRTLTIAAAALAVPFWLEAAAPQKRPAISVSVPLRARLAAPRAAAAFALPASRLSAPARPAAARPAAARPAAARQGVSRLKAMAEGFSQGGAMGDSQAHSYWSQAADGARALSGDESAGGWSLVPLGKEASLEARVSSAKAVADKIRAEVAKVIVGQTEMIDSILIAMIAGQHALLEGYPGVAKTETAKSIADAIQGQSKRVQGTPDKLPSDIIGSEVLQEDPATGKKDFVLKPGPVFTDILLVDEINRMPAKAQAALLEAMAERRVSIGNKTLQVSSAFTVLATQNPVEQEGTYRLPEAQLDRFMFKVIVPQPSEEELKAIMDRNASREAKPKASQVTTLAELDRVRKVAADVRLDDSLKDYINKIVMAPSVDPELKKVVSYSVYVRAAIFMAQAARVRAMMEGRAYVLPEDIKAVAPRIMRHRMTMSYEAKDMTPDDVVRKVLERVPVPNP